METQTNDFLEREGLGTLMRKYAVPCVISLLVAALYNIVDQIFIANADYLGAYGNAANTVVYPLTVVALAVAVMIGDGCCSYVSISLGAGKSKKASGSIGSAVIVSVISGIAIMAVYLIFAEPILTLFGGKVNEQTLAFSEEYFFWISLGIPFYMFGQAMNPIIRSDGSPKFAMISTLAGAMVNIILDPLFIYAFRWGMTGAAVATVAGQILTAVLSVIYLLRMKAVKLDGASFRFHPELMKKYISLGGTSFLSQISLVFSMAAVNNMVSRYSVLDPVFSQVEYTHIPMAVIGIVMKFFQIVISVAVGTAAGCIPVVGYNIGAKRKDRAKALFSRLLAAEAITGAVALLAVEVFPQQLIGIFGAANESRYYTDFAVKSFRTYLCLMPLATINKGTFIYLQSVGKAMASTVISLVREIVLGVGFALLLPRFFGLDGILYSFPAADLLTFAVALAAIVYTYKELSAEKPIKSRESSAE
ncbi:MAG: MATE family efflux transporter [Clostridiales bacterium]|nr:MATE family efflux transporter [Clostridiales bacterium]